MRNLSKKNAIPEKNQHVTEIIPRTKINVGTFRICPNQKDPIPTSEWKTRNTNAQARAKACPGRRPFPDESNFRAAGQQIAQPFKKRVSGYFPAEVSDSHHRKEGKQTQQAPQHDAVRAEWVRAPNQKKDGHNRKQNACTGKPNIAAKANGSFLQWRSIGKSQRTVFQDQRSRDRNGDSAETCRKGDPEDLIRREIERAFQNALQAGEPRCDNKGNHEGKRNPRNA